MAYKVFIKKNYKVIVRWVPDRPWYVRHKFTLAGLVLFSLVSLTLFSNVSGNAPPSQRTAAPGPMSPARPPLAEAAQAMHDAMEPQQQDLAQLEEELRKAEEQMTLLQQQIDDTANVLPESEKKVGDAMALEDATAINDALDQIIEGFPALDDKPISDFESRLPELEALVAKIEGAGDGGAE